MTTDAGRVRDAKPPLLLVRMMNPVLRLLLRTPVGRAIRPFALLEFAGRRTGRRFLVPVGWHSLPTGTVVFTPAPWRANFAGGIPVTVHHAGRHLALTGTLETDPDRVAAAMRSLVALRGSLRRIGVELPAGTQLTAADVRAVDRSLITFDRRFEVSAGAAVDGSGRGRLVRRDAP
jgi:hypothetical protein